MSLATLLSRSDDPDGAVTRRFACCDTSFTIRVAGWRRARAAARAEDTAGVLERRLDAFDAESAVAQLNRKGVVADQHVAAVVRRGLEYRERTDGAFDIVHGRLEHDLKAYLRGERQRPPVPSGRGGAAPSAGPVPADETAVRVSGSTVRADVPLDLNGLAKGYLVDRAHDALAGIGRRGFVDGGGDVTSPTGPVGIESPYGDDAPLTVLQTGWNVATSGGYRRRRDGVDHLYDPRTGRIGGRHDLVTVVAERDCTEADALATTLSTLPLDDALAMANGWDGAEALVVHGGVFHETDGWGAHVHGRDDDRGRRVRE